MARWGCYSIPYPSNLQPPPLIPLAGLLSCLATNPFMPGLLAMGSYDGSVGLYGDLGREAMAVMHGHTGGVTQVGGSVGLGVCAASMSVVVPCTLLPSSPSPPSNPPFFCTPLLCTHHAMPGAPFLGMATSEPRPNLISFCTSLSPSAHTTPWQVLFSRDGNFLYSGARKHAADSMQRCVTSTNQRIAFDIDPSNRHLATGGEDGQVWVYDLASGSKIAAFQAAQDTINGFAFHPCLPLAATSSGHRRFHLPPPLTPASPPEADNCSPEAPAIAPEEGHVSPECALASHHKTSDRLHSECLLATQSLHGL
ncbi:unnamed protein product [Closterium sp. NIES-65]|nr:unnamed protein product [Closterium sp. NIES-65]